MLVHSVKVSSYSPSLNVHRLCLSNITNSVSKQRAGSFVFITGSEIESENHEGFSLLLEWRILNIRRNGYRLPNWNLVKQWCLIAICMNCSANQFQLAWIVQLVHWRPALFQSYRRDWLWQLQNQAVGWNQIKNHQYVSSSSENYSKIVCGHLPALVSI